MKLHDLRPPAGSHTARTRVGRGIAAGKGKTAGRGTKGQKARAGGSIPPWFEGGQTPLHMRIPKLRGFKNRFKIDYEVVNIGSIAAAAERGAFEGGELPGAATKPKKAAPVTVNQELLRAVGLVRTLKKPLKILGNGELSTALFVVADAFTKSAVTKIESAGGTISILEVPTEELVAIGVTPAPAREARTAAGRAAATRKVEDRAARATRTAEIATEAAAASSAKAEKAPKAAKPKKGADNADAVAADADAGDEPAAEATAVAETAADSPAAEAAGDDAPAPDAEPASDDAPADAADAADAPDSAADAPDAPADASSEVETPDDGENA
jgi:large subunit ribosomal protein L15